MIKQINKKLHSQRGASFLFAILAFLVASMVSVTIVSAAYSGFKRVNSDREKQQAHLTLTSAAQLVRDEMLTTKYVKTTVTEYENGTAKELTDECTVSGTFKNEMKTAIESLAAANETYSSNAKAFTIESLEIDGAKTDTVEVCFSMKKDTADIYSVTFTMNIKDTKDVIFLTMKGDTKTETVTETENNTEKKTETVTISWIQPIISRTGAA